MTPFWCCPVVKEEVKLTNYRDVPRLRAQIVLALYCHISFQKEGVGGPCGGPLCGHRGPVAKRRAIWFYSHKCTHDQKLLLRSRNKYNSPDSCSNSPCYTFKLLMHFKAEPQTSSQIPLEKPLLSGLHSINVISFNDGVKSLCCYALLLFSFFFF